jgi:hypothetical protein
MADDQEPEEASVATADTKKSPKKQKPQKLPPVELILPPFSDFYHLVVANPQCLSFVQVRRP